MQYCKDILIDILKNSSRVLKPNGKIFFHNISPPTIIPKQNEKLIEFFKSKKFDDYTFSVETIDKFPYIIDIPDTNKISKEYFVFTKN
jgi:ubiquinone/menaquinone biosynthesis C-methylase UbiE